MPAVGRLWPSDDNGDDIEDDDVANFNFHIVTSPLQSIHAHFLEGKQRKQRKQCKQCEQSSVRSVRSGSSVGSLWVGQFLMVYFSIDKNRVRISKRAHRYPNLLA